MGPTAMAVLTFRTAAQQAGNIKSTTLRAIESRRPSATKTADGACEIEPSDFCRTFPAKPTTVAANYSTQRSAGHDATGDKAATVAPEVATQLAVMATELKALKEMVTVVRQSRAQWQTQAGRTTITLAVPGRPWWKRLAG